MQYAVIGFDSNAWFEQETAKIEYQGYNLRLVREKMEEREGVKYPVAISNQLIIPTTRKMEYESHETGLVFLSELSWLYGISIYDVEHGGGTVPVRFLTKFAGHRGGRVVVDLKYYKPMALNDTQRLAVGFYKEGRSNNSIFFKFLGLFKILEIQMNGDQRQQWLREYLADKWQGFAFEGKYEYVPRSPDDLQLFLYKYGRCAVAHAKEPMVDIHSLLDYRTISVCYDVIKQAVEHYMVEELGIPKLLHY